MAKVNKMKDNYITGLNGRNEDILKKICGPPLDHQIIETTDPRNYSFLRILTPRREKG